MTEITVNITTLPIVSDESCCDPDKIEEKCSRLWRNHRGWIIGTVIVSVVCAIIIVILVLNKNNNKSYPCLAYPNDTPASSVSVECLQYTWNSLCTASFTFPSNYNGWWRQSTQGGYMYRCSSQQQSGCGVGTYANVIIYMQLCNANYGGVP